MKNNLIVANLNIVTAPLKRNFLTARTTKTILSITLALLICSVSASAQHGYRLSKRITFKRGEISAVLKGTIKNRLEGHEYIFRARKGQTVKIRLRSAAKDVTFYLMDGEGNWMDEDGELREWTGEITDTGDHRLVISKISNGSANYTLEIQIASDI